jgi:apoptosis-inducing factor 3
LIMGTYNLLDQVRANHASSSDPDLAQGVAFDDLEDGGMLAGHVGGMLWCWRGVVLRCSR